MKIKNFFCKYFQYIDLFRVPFQFYFKGKTRKTSTTGILISLIIFTFLFYQFYYSEFFVKVSPNVITQTKENNEYISIDFNEEKNFFLLVLDRYSLERTTDQTIFELEAKYYDHGQVINKKLRPCIYSDLQNSMTEEYFHSLGYDKLFCMENKTFSLYNSGEDREWRFIQFLLYPCRNGTSNITCKPKEIIEQSLKNKFFSVAFETVDIDAHNYENPLLINFEPKTILINPDLKKYHSEYIKLAQVNTDDSWFFSGSNVRIQDGYMIDSVINDYEFRADISDPFINWSLLASKKQLLCTRNYQKLPEALASLAGTANLFWFFCFYFCQMATHVGSMKYIMNKLYDFDNPKKPRIKNKMAGHFDRINKRSRLYLETEKISEKKPASSKRIPNKTKQNIETTDLFYHNEPESKENQTSIIDLPAIKPKLSEACLSNTPTQNKEILNEFIELPLKNNEKNNNSENNNNIQINNENNIITSNDRQSEIHQNSNQTQSFELKKEYPFKVSVFEYLKFMIKKFFCLTLTKKEKLIKKAEEIYKEKLDISEILLKLQDIEKIKCLILNSDQSRLFSNLKKPHFPKRGTSVSKRLFFNSYKKCQNEQYHSQISKYLIENCDSNKIF